MQVGISLPSESKGRLSTVFGFSSIYTEWVMVDQKVLADCFGCSERNLSHCHVKGALSDFYHIKTFYTKLIVFFKNV